VANPSEDWSQTHVLFERVSDRLVMVSVHDPGALDLASKTFDYTDAASVADEGFRSKLPDQVLVEPE
jgi:hypothetical protein